MSGKKKALGRAFVRTNGKPLPTLPGAKLNPGGKERTPITLENGDVRYTEKLTHAEIEVDVAIDDETDIIALNEITEATITFEADTGQRYIMRNGFSTGPVNLSAGEGKGTLKFAGEAVKQA